MDRRPPPPPSSSSRLRRMRRTTTMTMSASSSSSGVVGFVVTAALLPLLLLLLSHTPATTAFHLGGSRSVLLSRPTTLAAASSKQTMRMMMPLQGRQSSSFSFSHAMGQARKKLYNKVTKSRVWAPLTRANGGRGGLGRPEVPHDELTYRRRGPGREMSRVPQAERYSSGDWLHNILNLPGSQVLQRIRAPVILNMLWALAVSAAFTYFNLRAIPSRVHTLLGSSLGLLLVFRTNTSYGRYWEGRTIWEKIHSKARDLARLVSLYEDCIGADKVGTVARLICAFPLVLREHLTGGNHKPEIMRLLGPNLSDAMDCAVNKPLWVCHRLGVLFRSIPESKNFSSRERLALLALVSDLSATIGSCERLVQTPVPLSYARHTSRFLTLFLWSLPGVLFADFQGVPLAFITGLCTWALFGILEIGLLIEDPFQRVLRSSWTGTMTSTIIDEVNWTIGENRNPSSSSSQLYSSTPSSSPGGGGGPEDGPAAPIPAQV